MVLADWKAQIEMYKYNFEGLHSLRLTHHGAFCDVSVSGRDYSAQFVRAIVSQAGRAILYIAAPSGRSAASSHGRHDRVLCIGLHDRSHLVGSIYIWEHSRHCPG